MNPDSNTSYYKAHLSLQEEFYLRVVGDLIPEVALAIFVPGNVFHYGDASPS